MTQEEKKELLLKDLCSRLPYFVMIQIEGKPEPEPLNSFMDDDGFWFQLYDENGIGEGFKIDQIKPYLRKMSSMTEKERKEYHDTLKLTALVDYPTIQSFDWLNSHYFDYRGLIEKGLAIEAPKNMYNAKTE